MPHALVSVLACLFAPPSLHPTVHSLFRITHTLVTTFSTLPMQYTSHTLHNSFPTFYSQYLILVSQNVPYPFSFHAVPMCHTSFYRVFFISQTIFTTLFTPLPTLYPILYPRSMPHLHSVFSVSYSPFTLLSLLFSILHVLLSVTTVHSIHYSPCHQPCHHLCIPSLFARVLFPSSLLHTLYCIPNASCLMLSSPFSSLLLYLHSMIHTCICASCTTSHVFSPSSCLQITHFVLGNLISAAQSFLIKFLHILSILFTL